jgi:DNA-binding winged helix-turn-helix (wHTH) protein/TolB-like protein
MRVGDWSVDAGLNELRQAGKVVRLEPKVMEVLIFLAAHPGEVVSREALLAAVWPGVIVGDDALTQAVIKLRKALGDTPKQPGYILTIPKRGYKLLAPVESAPSQDSVTPRVSSVVWRPYRSYMALTVLLLVLIVTGLWALFAPPHKAISYATKTTSSEVGLVIVPFQVLESTPKSLCLATGLTSELKSDLSRLSVLRVYTSTGTTASPDVHYRIDGIVQHDNGRVRVQVHLIDTRTGQELWSEQFDRPLRDLLDLQSELSKRLMNELPLKLSEAERNRAAHPYTRSVEAYELFLRGQSALLARGRLENEMARDFYLQAIQADPDFARAYAGLALTYAADYRHQWVRDGKEALVHAMKMAESARQIDPDIPEIYWALGFVHAQHREYQVALSQLSKAVQLNPSYADAYALMGGIETYLGRPEKSVTLLRTAQRLNPEAGYLYYLLLGRAYFFLNDFEQARINLSEALARNEADLEAHVYLAAVKASQHDADGAAWEVDEIRTLQPDFQLATWLQTYPLSDQALQLHLADTLHRFGL